MQKYASKVIHADMNLTDFETDSLSVYFERSTNHYSELDFISDAAKHCKIGFYKKLKLFTKLNHRVIMIVHYNFIVHLIVYQ